MDCVFFKHEDTLNQRCFVHLIWLDVSRTECFLPRVLFPSLLGSNLHAGFY